MDSTNPPVWIIHHPTGRVRGKRVDVMVIRKSEGLKQGFLHPLARMLALERLDDSKN